MSHSLLQIIRHLAVCLQLLSVCVASNGSEAQCNPGLMVPRNTTFKAHVKTELKINCTVLMDEDGYDHNEHEHIDGILPLVYIGSGTVGVMVIVIIVTIFAIRRQGAKSTRKEKTNKPQYMELQTSNVLLQSHHTSSSPSKQQSSASSRYSDSPPAQNPAPDGRLSDLCHSTESGEEQDSGLVYAALNHQRRVPRRITRQEIESEPSEYAAIRFQ
ncbi:hypothetical protein DNTS_005211 [Danionella cerebrum]|uniref:Uncharacterized protein n=1 Tax=Danionella cerebrum TaxID=2873325 RepID=A0A553RH75_9TELE|nr:hypothetical protein DNTS_005211 [Danionella translucida]